MSERLPNQPDPEQSSNDNENLYPEELRKKISDLAQLESKQLPDWLKDEAQARHQKMREEIDREKKFYDMAGDSRYIEYRDEASEHMSEQQNAVAEVQEARLGLVVRRLMERTDNDPEVIEKLSELINALGHQASFGTNTEPLGTGTLKDITEFLGEAAKALRWKVGSGGRPSKAAMPINLSKWE